MKKQCFIRFTGKQFIRSYAATPAKRTAAIQCSPDSSSETVVVANIFPDASASAAGVRTQCLLDGLAKSSNVHLVTSISDCSKNEAESKDRPQRQARTKLVKNLSASSAKDLIDDLADRGISWSCLPPNRSNQVHDFAKNHPLVNKVLFDRFHVEEAYSFAFKEHYPDASLLLDMQDMHSLRRGREAILKEWDKAHPSCDDPFQVLETVMNYLPSVNSPHLLRELASIHRCDLTLVCSPVELDLLQSSYGVASDKLCLAPFFVSSHDANATTIAQSNRRVLPPEPSRRDDQCPMFVFCGGFKHAPNVDAARLLLQIIWPKIRQVLPTSTLHIHGAYCPQEIQDSHNPNEGGVFVHGFTPLLDDVFQRPGSVLLAPLRFGAGIKGKIIDAWTYGMPVVTTPIGSEGMVPDGVTFGGGVAWSMEEFVEMAVELATSPENHSAAARQGQRLLLTMHRREENWTHVQDAIAQTANYLERRRNHDFTRALFWHHSARSTKYFSRWIELKETLSTNQRTQAS